MIEIRHLSGRLGEFHLKDNNFTVQDGEYLVILGPTGAGKTVLIEYIVGIHKPDKGRIIVDGEDITPLYTEERNIAYVPQDYALFPNMNVKKNIAYGLKARGLPNEEINETVANIISMLGLDYIRHRMPLNLSGGEKQRVALGRALATRPRLVLLDEPLSALDENLRSDMARGLRRLQRSINGTFLHVSHNFEESSDVADRIAIMNQGEIVQLGTLDQIKSAPRNEFVARFLKSQNIFPACVDGSVLRAEGLTFLASNNHLEGDVTAVVRPEHIEIIGNGACGPDNVYKGRVRDRFSKPHFTEIHVDIGLFLTIYTTEDKGLRRGDRISIRIPPEKFIVMDRE